MSKEYDKVIKELLKDTVEALLEKITGVDIKKVELLDPKLQITDEREADFILKAELKDGSQEIYHIEFQVTNDNNMGYRELRYWVYLRQVYKLPVKQYVVYIGKKPLKMKSTLEEDNITYSYTIIDMKTVDCEKFLYADRPEEVIISILCDYKGRDVKMFIREILERIRELVKEETLQSKYIRQLEILSNLRDLQNYVGEEVDKMAFTFDLTKDYRFQQGMEKGIEKGREEGREKGREEGREKGREEGMEKGLKEGIELALEVKFGFDSLELIEKIKDIKDVQQLENIKDIIKNTNTVAEFIQKITRN